MALGTVELGGHILNLAVNLHARFLRCRHSQLVHDYLPLVAGLTVGSAALYLIVPGPEDFKLI